MSESAALAKSKLSIKELRLVIGASSVGTLFEWYDFFIYGTLSQQIRQAFFPTENATLGTLLVWAGFAIGFGFRPLGAILFGFLGDRLGRKYTFLVTVTLMGIATAGVGLIPSATAIGLAAPLLVLLLRILQGLALGGEYGGATIYVAEHCSPNKRGFYTSFIQGCVTGGFVLSVAVVLATRSAVTPADFTEWGWRLPFILSIALLAVSLWMRLKLNESPVFRAMKEEGRTSANPFKESFTYPGNKKRLFVALFGITGSLTTIFYAAYFSSLSFLKGPMRVDPTTAEIAVLIAGPVVVSLYVVVGKWSDSVGRKLPIMLGNILILLTIFPAFWALGGVANPGLVQSAKAAPVIVAGPDCRYDPFANVQETQCGKLLSDLTAAGVPYTLTTGETLSLTAGSAAIPLDKFDWSNAKARKAPLEAALTGAGYDFSVQQLSAMQLGGIVGLLIWFGLLSSLTYGSVAALLAEMFPPRIRYSSMSIPYHIGAGYFGGFLPVIAGYIVAKTGDAYSGLWYTWGFVLIGLIVGWWGIPGGKPRDFADAETKRDTASA